MNKDEQELYRRLSKVQAKLMKLVAMVESAKLALLKGDGT